jgi:DNA-binding NtrC family response regulator
MTRIGTSMPEPESLGTELNIEGVRSEWDIVAKWTMHVLALCGDNKTVAARVLGIDRRSLYRRLEGIRLKNAVHDLTDARGGN